MSDYTKAYATFTKSIKILFGAHKEGSDHDDRYPTKADVADSLTTKTFNVGSLTLDLIDTTGELDVSLGSVFTIDASAAPLTVGFTNVPATRALFISVRVLGIGPITWPAAVEWSDGTEPLLGANWTIVSLSFIDGTWYGSADQKN